MSENEKDFNTDVVELCTLLQCLGFNLRSLDTSDVNLSQEVGGGSKTVVINCQSSGIHVVLESGNAACSCPVTSQESSGVWQVSAVSGGKHHDKEIGSTLLASLPKTFTEQVTKQLRGIVRSIREQKDLENELAVEKRLYSQEEIQGKDALPNRSTSMIEFKVTPEKRNMVKIETPTRYRSLGCLDNPKEEFELPAPRPLKKVSDLAHNYKSAENSGERLKLMCKRQCTYTVSTPGSSRNRNRTSSPIHTPASNMLERLVSAEKVAEDLRNKLADLVQDFKNDERTSSISSLALDVSKISLLKVNEPSKNQFASSPNLSASTMLKDDLTKSKLRRFESASTSNLSGRKKLTPKAEVGSKLSKLKKLSPSYFFSKKECTLGHTHATSQNESKCPKMNTASLLKAKITKPIRTGTKQRNYSEPSQVNTSANKNKYGHIKSTIPRPTPIKKL